MQGLQGFARDCKSRIPKPFLFSGLLGVAPYCVPGGIRVVSKECELRVTSSFAIQKEPASPLREGVVRPQRPVSGKKSTHSFPLPVYSAPGGLPQAPGRAA
jgi:hypothetical protein